MAKMKARSKNVPVGQAQPGNERGCGSSALGEWVPQGRRQRSIAAVVFPGQGAIRRARSTNCAATGSSTLTRAPGVGRDVHDVPRKLLGSPVGLAWNGVAQRPMPLAFIQF